MDILIGTKNDYKATEIASFLENIPGVIIHFWSEFGREVIVEEDQPSLKKNAEKKALEISELTGWYVLTSDGGIDIPGLGDRWDILKNQRIVGENKTDLEKCKKLLYLMKNLKGESRKASYRLALALAKKGRFIWSAEGVTDKGYILDKLPDNNIPAYRWVGHLWYYPKYKKVFNKLGINEKEEVRKQGEGLKRIVRLRLKEMLSSTKVHS